MRRTRRDYTLALLAASALAFPAAGDDGFDDWAADDPEARALAVNEGELAFLAVPPDKPVHHHQNTLSLDAASLRDGWTRLEQCHTHLDAVPRVQITYRPGRVRDLTIDAAERIGEAWVDGHTVQLRDVRPGARLCVHAESRALTDMGDGMYSLRNGPFMRRFLDGYYPMRVSVTVAINGLPLRVVRVSPEAQDGFRVWQDDGGLHLDAWFEGMLHTEVVLERTDT